MKSLVLTLCIIAISVGNVNAQMEAITKDGKKVVLNNDGTWKYEPDTEKPNSPINTDCSELISTEVDKVTGKSTTGAKDVVVISQDGGKTGFGFYILKGSKSIIYSITAVGAGNCIDDNDKMNVLFRDGTRLELYNDGDFNCDGKFTLYFGGLFGKKRELEMFATKEIETIRIWTSKSYVEQNLDKSQSLQLLRITDCLRTN